MSILAHFEGSQRWLIEPWEFHPALNHFPIAFLVGAVALDLYAWWRGRPGLAQVATGLLIVGLITGLVAALAGLVAFFTVPGHTEEAHRLMYWHLILQGVSLLLFAGPAWVRWRNWAGKPSLASRLGACFASMLLLIGSAIGGYVVYHGGAGVSEELLAPVVREHKHQSDQFAIGHRRQDGHEDKAPKKGTDEIEQGEEEQEIVLQHEHAQKSKNASKDGTAKKQDAHQGHEHKKTEAHQHKEAGKEQDQKAQYALPAVPPASAAATYVPDGYLAHVVLYNLNYPSCLEFDDKGNLYIAEGGPAPGGPTTPTRIVRLQLAGEVETVVSEGLAGPVTDLRWYRGKLYISHRGKISLWSETEKLVDLVTGVPSGQHTSKQIMRVGPDGRLYLGQGQRLVRIDSKTNKVEPFFGPQDLHRQGNDSHAQPAHKGHDHKTHGTESKKNQKSGEGDDHAHHAEPSKKEMPANEHKHAEGADHHPIVEDNATPGPRRLVDIRFSPRGQALYIVDFGATFMTPDGPRSVPGTGVVWRIISEDAATPMLMP